MFLRIGHALKLTAEPHRRASNMASEPISFMGFIVAGFTSILVWAGGLTKLAYDNKARIDVLDERSKNTDEKIDTMCAKIDKVIEHLLGGGT
jgi:hypothetical protein